MELVVDEASSSMAAAVVVVDVAGADAAGTADPSDFASLLGVEPPWLDLVASSFDEGGKTLKKEKGT